MNENVIAIIPARGGSKGIPRKNIGPLNGKPLLAYTIEAAQATPSITRVAVSTDDPEIGAVAERFGAAVIWRPAEISGDTVSSESALLHVLDHLQRTEGYRPDIIVFLQCTAPLTLPEDIEGTIQTLLREGADSALTVTPFHYFLWKKKNTDAVGINHDKHNRLMRQEQETQYLETGSVYVMRTEGFIEARHRFFGKTAMYVMPRERSFEIDEPVDFSVAEVLMCEQKHRKALNLIPGQVEALVLDFDGVFTDNKVIVFQDGSEGVIADRGDGWGLSQLKDKGLQILVLSTEQNPVVLARCEKLGLSVLQEIENKWAILQNWLAEKGIDSAKVIYVGNDVNDLDCLKGVGCGVVVRDAHPAVIPHADIVLQHAGGKGAIREIVDLILEKMKGL